MEMDEDETGTVVWMGEEIPTGTQANRSAPDVLIGNANFL
jgi:hypothetical protein